MASSSSSCLLEAFRAALSRREARSSRRRLTLVAADAVDFSSNDFLSLSRSAIFRSRYLRHLQTAPETTRFASTGSRLLDGNSVYAEELERFVAGFHCAPTGLLFNSGYDANVGVLSCVPQPGDVVLYDELIHASVHEGMRLSRAGACIKFAHSSPQSLREVLQREIDSSGGGSLASGSRSVFVVVESVYSMDGDIAPIREFVDVVDSLLPRGNGHFVVDEAHATGVFGPNGAGIVQELGLQDRMLIRVHTFGKALASHGAIVLCGTETRDYLINYARSLIYTTALGLPYLAAIRTAYELLSEGETVCLQDQLQLLIRHLRRRLSALDAFPEQAQPQDQPSRLLHVDHFPRSPIFSLRTPVPRQLASVCQRKGFVVRAIMSPTVPRGSERVRVCLHAGNTTAQVDALVEVIAGWLAGSRAQL